MESTIISVDPHEITSDLLDAMMGVREIGHYDSGHCVASAIIVAHHKGKRPTLPLSQRSSMAQDWSLFFLWPFKKTFRPGHSPQSDMFTLTPCASEVVADIVPATSRGCRFRKIVHQYSGAMYILQLARFIASLLTTTMRGGFQRGYNARLYRIFASSG
ncbi:hypothetical protein BDR07DRAFT_1410852 [Suillus spraguei]|nr:hypothetical protein BDR07DRAFT_1410852 [Suillus spraguei]